MPAHNAERYIAESIQSVLDQTYGNWELVVVDDGSTDKTAETVQRFVASENRVKYVFQQNSRQGKARNTGIGKSQGSLIAFLDSDDLWFPEKLERQVQTLIDTKADVVYSDVVIFYEAGAGPGPTEFSIAAGKIEGSQIFDLLLMQNRIPVASVILRKEIFNIAGPFEESEPYQSCEDYDLWLKLAAHGASFYGMTTKLVRYRRHPQAMTHKESNVLKPMLRVVRRHIDGGNLNENEKRSRLRGLYRNLIAALLAESELAEAREYFKEFSDWDKSGVVTYLQKLLMKISPRSFNKISREFLYRVEWHLTRLTGRLNKTLNHSS